MKTNSISIVWKVFIILLLFLNGLFTQGQPIKIMTCNIRVDVPSDGINSWNNRKDFLCDLIKFYNPDIIGIQEVLLHQLEYINTSFKHYSYLGVGQRRWK